LAKSINQAFAFKVVGELLKGGSFVISDCFSGG
jgi:hypothetical protein